MAAEMSIREETLSVESIGIIAAMQYECAKTHTIVTGNFENERNVREEFEMLERHPDLFQSNFIRASVVYPKVQSVSKIGVKYGYVPNPFNASLKKDCDEIDARIQERDWVRTHITNVCDWFCLTFINENNASTPIFGSCAHRGFVNKIFGMDYLPTNKTVYGWINEIGTKFDPVVIKSLCGGQYSCKCGQVSDSRSPYANFLCSHDVRNLCEYCEVMFQVNKFEVAKYPNTLCVFRFAQFVSLTLSIYGNFSYDRERSELSVAK